MVLPALSEGVLTSRVGLINIAQYHLLRIPCVVPKRALLKQASSQPQLFSLNIQPAGWWLFKRWSETEVKIVGFLAVWRAEVWGDNLCPGREVKWKWKWSEGKLSNSKNVLVSDVKWSGVSEWVKWVKWWVTPFWSFIFPEIFDQKVRRSIARYEYDSTKVNCEKWKVKVRVKKWKVKWIHFWSFNFFQFKIY